MHEQHTCDKWDKGRAEYVNQYLNDGIAKHFFDDFLNSVITLETVSSVSRAYEKFISQATKRGLSTKKVNPKNTFPRNRWYDNEYKNIRSNLNCLHSAGEEGTYQATIRHYKKVTQRKQRKHQLEMNKELMNCKNSEKMWELLRSLVPKLIVLVT